MDTLVKDLSSKLSEALAGHAVAFDELTLEVNLGSILPVLRFLRDDYGFTQLIDICASDYPGRNLRFEVVYHLLSMRRNARVRVKTATDDATHVASAVDIFPNANWYEREVFDMYGVLFSAHPDMRRLLTDYNFDGYPLRKDFPLTGHVELRYDAQSRQVVYEPVALGQDYRSFDFESPWEGVHTAPVQPQAVTPKRHKRRRDDAGG